MSRPRSRKRSSHSRSVSSSIGNLIFPDLHRENCNKLHQPNSQIFNTKKKRRITPKTEKKSFLTVLIKDYKEVEDPRKKKHQNLILKINDHAALGKGVLQELFWESPPIGNSLRRVATSLLKF